MTLRLLATSLAATLLLAGTPGCAKKDAPAGPALNTGIYKLDGKTVTCTVKATTSAYYGSNASFDYLDLYFTTTPQPASGQQLLHLVYQRPSPTAPYELSTVYLFDKGSLSLTCSFTSTAATATLTTEGSYTGTFAATEDGRSTAPAPYAAITAGIFANVRR